MEQEKKRRTNFIRSVDDMEAGYSLGQAVMEADRCLLCYDAPCSEACPADTDPGTFIRKLRLKNIKGAVRTIKQSNILGCVCGIICPTDRLCEEACAATEIDRPINIGRLQRFLVEYGRQINFNPLGRKTGQGERIAVMGSGPAGLSVAAELAKEGMEVTIFEASEKPGGVLRYGVPSFRLNQEILDRELADVLSLGVKIECGKRIEGPGAIDELREDYDAVFIGAGLWKPFGLNIPGSDLNNVMTAMEFLKRVKEGDASMRELVSGKNVAVIGGGSTAMDTANTCKALQADRVYCIALERLEELPADKHDLQMAIDNFVVIKPHSMVKEITGKNGVVTGLKGVETEWKTPGDLSPSNAREVEGTEFSLKTDVVIMAIGAGPEGILSEMMPEVRFDESGLIKVNPETMATSVEGIYAGGDVVRGPALAVEAVADGKAAAAAIVNYLRKQ